MDQRLPFSFYGRGLGPKFRLGFETLDVGDVALGGAHTYEVPVQNISEIPGSMQCDGLVGPPSGMGMKIEPLLLDIAPGQYGAFYVNFSCTGKPGPFEDEIKFSTCQTGDVFYVTVKYEEMHHLKIFLIHAFIVFQPIQAFTIIFFLNFQRQNNLPKHTIR